MSPVSWLLPASTRMGWATTKIANPAMTASTPVAYLFRGNGAVFTPGFGRLCDRLRSLGIWAEDLRCTGDRWAVQHLTRQRAQGKLLGPIALLGHSRGGRRALVAARLLANAGIDVDLVICLDVAFPPIVPAYVRRAIHLYRSQWRIYPARPLRASAESRTAIDNIDLDATNAPFSGQGLHHLNITASAALHDWVVNEIGEVAVSSKGDHSKL